MKDCWWQNLCPLKHLPSIFFIVRLIPCEDTGILAKESVFHLLFYLFENDNFFMLLPAWFISVAKASLLLTQSNCHVICLFKKKKKRIQNFSVQKFIVLVYFEMAVNMDSKLGHIVMSANLIYLNAKLIAPLNQGKHSL